MRLLLQLLFWLALIAISAIVADRTVAPGLIDSIMARLRPQTEGEPGTPTADPIPDRPVAQTAERGTPSASPAGGIDANRNLRINAAGLEIIKTSEGLRLEAYDAGGKSYIGYGHQMKPGDPRQISNAEAERLLRDDIAAFEAGVKALLTRPATENQFSAMVSLSYNIGLGRFRSGSDVLRKFNAGDVQGAADAFRNHNKVGGKEVAHLTTRREKERALFLTP